MNHVAMSDLRERAVVFSIHINRPGILLSTVLSRWTWVMGTHVAIYNHL